MTYTDPPTSYRLTVWDIPPRLYWEFKDVCKKRGISTNEAIIRMMERFTETESQ